MLGSFRRSLLLTALLSAAVLMLPATAAGASGDLDSSFSGDGQQFVNFAGAADFGYDVALQSGRIVVAGITGTRAHEDLALTRLTGKGAVDTTFGRNGRVRTDVAGNSDEISGGLAILQSGKILVAGDSRMPSGREKIAAVRYRPNGGIDHTFGGGDGKAFASFGSQNAFGYDMAVQSDGKFVVVGESDRSAAASSFLLVRFTANGGIDRTFGTNGFVRTPFGTGFSAGYRIALTPGGKIVACGWTQAKNKTFDTAVARYMPGGRPDSSFSGDGKVITRLSSTGDDYCNAMALRSAGRILLGDFLKQGTNQNMGFLQYHSDGTLDRGFSGDGRQVLDFGGPDHVSALTLQPDGRILVVGDAGTSTFAVVRLRGGGTVDPTFGTGGVAAAPLRGSSGYAYGVALQPDGKIVVAGEAADGSHDFAVARLLP